MIIAIHQPNYAPWLGYFAKIAQADVFVFLRSAQFSKGSFTNRVKILSDGAARWLTVPAKARLGMSVGDIETSKASWPAAHLSTLANAYRSAPAFDIVWQDVEKLYAEMPSENLANSNEYLVRAIAQRIGLTPRFLSDEAVVSAADAASALRSDDRLVELCRRIDPTAIYLSGSGGREYQDEHKFSAAGVSLKYSGFDPAPYPQMSDDFVHGLSILDAVFNVGWTRTGELVRGVG